MECMICGQASRFLKLVLGIVTMIGSGKIQSQGFAVDSKWFENLSLDSWNRL